MQKLSQVISFYCLGNRLKLQLLIYYHKILTKKRAVLISAIFTIIYYPENSLHTQCNIVELFSAERRTNFLSYHCVHTQYSIQ